MKASYQGVSQSFGRFRMVFAFLLLLSFSSAFAAICGGGKTVHVKLPASWGGQMVLRWDNFSAVTLVDEGNGWSKFSLDIAGAPTYDVSKFSIFQKADGWNDPKIYKTYWGTTVQMDADVFTCADFGTGSDIYISENEADLGKTFVGTNPPNAKYFHFLSPDESIWFQGNPIMVVAGGTPVKMVPDPNACGWFITTYFNVDPPTDLVISLDISPIDAALGVNGVEDEIAQPIDLKTKFETVVPAGGTHLYFDPELGAAGWTATDPGDARQCSYNMAAIIYDTDASLHGSFSCDNYPNVATTKCYYAGVTWPGQRGIPCIGVTKNIVQPVLGADRKPIYNPASTCFKDQASFDMMFRETPPVNKLVCHDLPFKRTSDGLWEYDSYNEPEKGFYPLEGEVDAGTGTKREAYGGILMGDGAAADGVANWGAVNPLTGMPFIDTRLTMPGEFDTGTNPDVYNNEGWGACPNTGKPGVCRPKSMKNQHFCFETHADFIYRPGQKFYFRGDDDIWVFINNKLVVDLGGTHLAAPDYVNLDTITGIVQGATYPIDIFFCDRRTDMSNIRIKTNMYFEQKNSLFYEFDNATGAYVIKKLQTGGKSCEALTGDKEQIVDGSTLQLLYTLVSTKGDTMDGNPLTPAMDSHLSPGTTVYGGIRIENGVVYVDTNSLTLPPGRYRLNIQEASDLSAKVTINIRISGNTNFYSVNGKTDANSMYAVPAVDTLAGRLVRLRMGKVANGDVDTEGEAAVQLSISDPRLLVFKDSAGTIPYANMEVMMKADGDSTVDVWATAPRTLGVDTATFSITLRGSKSPPVFLKFHMPRFAFVKDSTGLYPANALGAVKDPINGSAPNFSFVNYPTYLVVFDPKHEGVLCTDCEDVVTFNTLDSLAYQAADGGTVLQFKNGRLLVYVRGTGLVQGGKFTINGLVPEMVADWSPINLIPPPTPRVTKAEMYDQNSDGKADWLFVEFNRSILGDIEDMPDFMVIRWPSTEPDTTIHPGKGVPTPQFTNNPSDLTYQNKYPSNPSNEVQSFVSTDGLTMGIPYTYDKVNTSGVGDLQTWFTFIAEGVKMQIAISQNIADKMGPVIQKANIRIASGSSINQYDSILVNFSEPIDTAGIGIQYPLEFRLLSSNNNAPRIVPPNFMSWNPSKTVATLRYDINSSAERPREGDSVRIDTTLTTYVMKDAIGNLRSTKNPFVRIEGDKRPEVQTIYYAEFDATKFQSRTKSAPFVIGKVDMYATPDAIKEKILTQHGPVLGHVVRTDLAKIFADSKATYRGKTSKELKPEQVVLHYQVYYHTNMGAFVAGQKGSVTCGDEMYMGDCSKAGVNGFPLIAWNMTSQDKRFVGSGAYLSYIKTWVTVPEVTASKLKAASRTETQVFGVVRKTKGNLIKITEPKN